MIWIIGSGNMAIEYTKVLVALNIEYEVVGRSEKSCKKFESSTGKKAHLGGMSTFLAGKPKLPDAVIVAVSVDSLADTSKKLLDYGIKKLLIEKPGALQQTEFKTLIDCANKNKADVFIAYNRRFYRSVQAVKKLIQEDGGATSFNFEITEWSHVIRKNPMNKQVMDRWFLANTTHVVDTAFFLCGLPEKLVSFNHGSIDWHPQSSRFVGSGISKKGALFSYQGNWEAPGRWSIDISTKRHRYYLCPMEKVFIQDIGSVNQEPLKLDYNIDEEFKPGLYKQVEAFIIGDNEQLCTLDDQFSLVRTYENMAGYS